MLTVIEQFARSRQRSCPQSRQTGKGQLGAMQKVQTAASQLEQAASQRLVFPLYPKNPQRASSSTIHSPSRPATSSGPVPWEPWAIWFQGDHGALPVFFLCYRATPINESWCDSRTSLSNKEITVQILSDINHSIQRYMFMLLITNVLVALLAWMTFHWIGLENAGAWAVAGGFASYHILTWGLVSLPSLQGWSPLCSSIRFQWR